ncbi:uncharacterized protein LOC136075260 [Hydra vulgaris]|uniref:Uncharacterized protein LOC136075260 n=1 Tax=Hydra vulgaris TaxID=6087 RepID=A0ABM4B4Y1_HYDVU
MNLFQTIFFLPCAMCFLCWSQINDSPTTTQSCELCAISRIETSSYSSTMKTCPLYNSKCNTFCHDSIRLIAIMDSSIKITSCKATCCQTDLCNNDALLNNVPNYNGDMQSTGNNNTLLYTVPYYNGDMQSTGSNDALLTNVPYYNGVMQGTEKAFLYWKIFFGILFVGLAQKCLL